ncbi:MAG TPA: fluoride efflux transporter CrcB [Verrucomicrobiae bacterium]|nr:fluoride efflux transporter CrcB [Verrucomicrobiae bacterium]
MNLLIVMAGGALGALARYGLGGIIGARWEHGFPLGTFVINIVGSFLLGLINVLVLERFVLTHEWRIGLGVGFLGAFTTFSTFSYETLVLMEEGSYGLACVYVSSSILVGLLAALCGMYIARIV